MAIAYIPRGLSPTDVESITTRLLNGETTSPISREYGKSTAWSWIVATRNGLFYNRAARRWMRDPEETPVSNGEWNLTTDDYEALLTSEREQSSNGATADTAVTEQTNELNSIDDDIKEALDLLARAEQQRKEDIATIAQLQQSRDENRTAIKDLRGQVEALQRKVDELDVENKRLMESLKKEISRGFLRQSMDSLRKVL